MCSKTWGCSCRSPQQSYASLSVCREARCFLPGAHGCHSHRGGGSDPGLRDFCLRQPCVLDQGREAPAAIGPVPADL